MFSSLRRQSQSALFRVARLQSPSVSSVSVPALRLLTAQKPCLGSVKQLPAVSIRLFSNSSLVRNSSSEAFAREEHEDVANQENEQEFEQKEYEHGAEEASLDAAADALAKEFQSQKESQSRSRSTAPTKEYDGPLVTFKDLLDHGLVDKRLMKPILDDLKFEKMTEVQRETIRETLKGTDVVAQAKTGTGKTIAFLLPVLERIIHSKKPLQEPRGGRVPLDIRSLIISPTRELAQQIARDAQTLIKYSPKFKVQIAVGGQGKGPSLRQMHREGCNILVATPGRLYDLLTDKEAGISFHNLESVVLDEADNLLDRGFAEAIKDIMKHLPSKETRQTMLFSATLPTKVKEMIKISLKRGYKTLKLVDENEVPTHHRIPQRLIRARGFENTLPALYELIEREMAKSRTDHSGQQAGMADIPANAEPFKAIVFFPTTKYAAFAASVFRQIRLPVEEGNSKTKSPFAPARIVEIHSRLTQSARERAAAHFRDAESGIMFSSDVVARGMDFPGVTHVIQVGQPMSQEQYIHRVGRTGRGDKNGEGYIILADIEAQATLRELGNQIKLQEHNDLTIPKLDLAAENTIPADKAEILTRTVEAIQRTTDDEKAGAYRANLGYYSAIKDKVGFIKAINRWTSVGWGMEKPPPISPLLIKKLGLSGLGLIEGEPLRSFGGGRPGGDRFGGGSRPGGDRFGGGDRPGFKPRDEGFPPRDGGFRPREPREGGFAPREGGFKPREGGGTPREGGFKPREGYTPREEGFKPREGGFTPREGGFTPREGGFKPREGFTPREGSFKPREGGFTPREGFKPREGGFTPREGGFKPREGGFTPREGGFKPREGGFTPREGGFKPREGGFRPREGGFKPRDGGFTPREGGFKPREGGFTPREGGFKPREGGFTPREGGFKPREGGFAPREGGFKPREGGFRPREGGFKPREGGNRWGGRGNVRARGGR